MKFKTLALSALLAFSGLAFAGGDDHKPRHGGIFIEGKVADMEVLAKPESIQVYVYDHGKPAKIAGAKGKVTLLNGAEKSEAELAQVGDKMEAKGPFKVAKGTKGIVTVNMAGKPATVGRFEVK
jgi:hypothetical protein